MQYDEIVNKLKALSNPKAVEGMARFEINPENTYGVFIPNLRKMAKDIGVNHTLARQLLAIFTLKVELGGFEPPTF